MSPLADVPLKAAPVSNGTATAVVHTLEIRRAVLNPSYQGGIC